MRASTSRFVYCLGLLAVTACAVLPETLTMKVSDTPVAAPPSAEMRLAHAIRDRLELSAIRDAGDPGIVEATINEAALRNLAFADDAVSTRRELISALANELSDALAKQSATAATHPDRIKADAAVSGLTAAINTEVRRNRV